MLASFPEKLLKQKLPDLQFVAEVKTQWGARQDNHRLELHQAVQDFREFSISHAPEAGGYFAVAPTSSRTLPVGFDIEKAERVRSIVIKRVMNSGDDVPLRVPQSLVWSAKEAAFKSLKGPGQPVVISEIMVFDWKYHLSPVQNAVDGLWEFSYVPQPKKKGTVINEAVGIGYAWIEGALQFAVCIRTRQ